MLDKDAKRQEPDIFQLKSIYIFKKSKLLAWAVDIAVYRRLDGRLSVATISMLIFFFWHKCWCCSRLPFRVLTGNDVSEPLFSLIFSFFFFSLLSMFLMECLLKSKTYLAKDDRSAKEPRGRPLSWPHRRFLGPLVIHSWFSGSGLFQAVCCCRPWVSVPAAAMLVFFSPPFFLLRHLLFS